MLIIFNVNFRNIKYSCSKTKIRDEIKNDFCKKNDIILIRISYDENIDDALIRILK